MIDYVACYKVRVTDSDSHGNIKLSALLGMMQETALEHAKFLGVGRDEMLTKNMAWVLSRMNLTVLKNPKFGDRINIKTWASFKEKAFTTREFIIESEDGEVLSTARTLWSILNIQTRRLERLSGVRDWMRLENTADESSFEAVEFPNEFRKHSNTILALREFIDLNGHINNTVYVSMCTEALDEEFLKDKRIKNFSISFLSEIFCGEKIESSYSIQENCTYHILTSNDKIKAKAIIQWK